MSAAADRVELKKILLKFGFKKGNGDFYEHKANDWYAEIQDFGNWCNVWMVGQGLKSGSFPGGWVYGGYELEKELALKIKK